MNPGELDTLITVHPLTRTRGAGGDGSVVESAGTTVSLWAKWTDVRGREYTASQAQETAEVQARVIVRYLSALTEDYVLTKGGATYDIVAPPAEVFGRRKFMELSVKRNRPA